MLKMVEWSVLEGNGSVGYALVTNIQPCSKIVIEERGNLISTGTVSNLFLYSGATHCQFSCQYMVFLLHHLIITKP